jgi:GH15 family glucan-1,4-alpha-glucosidase
MVRQRGYAAIEDYALIGDGRTAALVASDGSIDWLCLPNFDSPSVFASILDADRGGCFELRPAVHGKGVRRYVPDTNVLETIWTTDRGAVRVVDAMTLSGQQLAPMREIVRKVDGLSGTVPMEWRVSPRFHYGSGVPRPEWRGCVPVASCGADAIAVASWDAGRPEWHDTTLVSRFEIREGSTAVLALASTFAEPLVIPGRHGVETRLADTIKFWQRWSAPRYDGPWAEHVRRSALVLKALIFAPSGASVAAPTTSVPEDIGGERNWDYRYCWVRDSNFAIAALLNLGCYEEAQSLFWWFMHATALTEPELHVLYRLDGGVGDEERTLPLAGHQGSRPVRIGNGAIAQKQHDIYGCLFEAASMYSTGHGPIDSDIGAILGRIADHVCEIWHKPDAGIWEVRNGPFHFTHSKAMCWVALDRAVGLAERGELPSRHLAQWRREADAIRRYIEEQCWSDRLRSYTRIAGEDDVDASLLTLPIVGYTERRSVRLSQTIDAIVRTLGSGDFVYRYRAPDGVAGGEGCFLNCSFWLVSALAGAGRIDEAGALMERLLARANDVGLYSEEADPASGAFLGNFPQALVHLALIDAAVALRDASRS